MVDDGYTQKSAFRTMRIVAWTALTDQPSQGAMEAYHAAIMAQMMAGDLDRDHYQQLYEMAVNIYQGVDDAGN